ncbi:guanine nucleotide-binding protein-like 3 homolog [Haliotis asinina]|uniref:guanine nucleotide-binding protein-like 3 homolog n=1 Tax=Haliotis asinina TaxID=109174 RepID=UPI0035324D35
MVNKFLKSRSKRQTTRMRSRIAKKVKEHNRKVKRKQKKNPNKRKRKDPGVPNSLPFKETVLKEAEDLKAKKVEMQEKIQQKRQREREKLLAKKRNLDSVVSDALRKQKEFDKKTAKAADAQKKGKAVENSLKTFYKEFKKVVDAADVVLEVLDARDPLGSRCTEVEQAVLNSGTNKKLVLVLNKIDLVPKENVEAWLKHLRNEFPSVAFKASTQTQSDNLARSKMKLSAVTDDLLKSSHCLGAEVLMKLLGNYCRNQDIRTTIRVGVVGFPNTGKSSIINSLKRSKACNVGSMPGITKSMQEVQLDKHIKLLDSPGVVMAQMSSDTVTVLRNVVKIEQLADPVEPVEAILKRCSKQQLMLHYNLPDYNGAGEFLSLLARRRGKLKKGGVPDVEKAARSVIQDWTTGKITYYTHPPEQTSLPTHLSAELVQEMGKAFSIEDIKEEETKILQSLKPKSSSHVLMESLGPVKGIVQESDLPADEEDAEMEESDDEDEDDDDEVENMEGSDVEEDVDEQELNVKVSLPSSLASSIKSSAQVLTGRQAKAKKEKGVAEKTDILQLNKQRMKDFKKMKKQRKRDGKVADSLSDALTSAFGFSGDNVDADGDYNFDEDFH